MNNGRDLTYVAHLPDVVAMLCAKVRRRGARIANRDAMNAWHLLESSIGAGVELLPGRPLPRGVMLLRCIISAPA